MKRLQIIPCTINRESEGEKLIRTLPKNAEISSGWWYLHGDLEHDNGYDIAYAIQYAEDFGKKTFNWTTMSDNKILSLHENKPYKIELYINGEIDIDVYGFYKPCKGFFWTTEEFACTYEGETLPIWKQRGLICYADDKDGCDYARAKMKERAIWL